MESRNLSVGRGSAQDAGGVGPALDINLIYIYIHI